MMKFLSLVTVALMVSMTSAIPLVPGLNVIQSSDNDLVDAKNLNLGIDILSGHHKDTNSSSNAPAQPQAKGPPSGGHITQLSDNDLVDAKNANIGINILNRKREALDVNDYFTHHASLSKRKLPAVLPVISQTSDNDLIDAKNAKIKVNALNDLHVRLLQGSSLTQTSDNDGVDLKNLNVDLNVANHLLGRRDIIEQSSDDDLVDLKDLVADVNLLDRDVIEEALSVLRRANYPVDSMLRKRSSADMYQEVQGDYTCLCSKTLSSPKCNSPPPKQLKPKPSPRPSHVAHHSKQYTLPIVRPTANAVAKPPIKADFTPASPILAAPTVLPSPVVQPSPVVECPAGWTHAAPGAIMQYTDNDLLDLKNLKLDINILSNTGETTSSKKDVPAVDQPKCTGDVCCYKQSAAPIVTKTKDNDLLDLKNVHLGLNALNNLIGL